MTSGRHRKAREPWSRGAVWTVVVSSVVLVASLAVLAYFLVPVFRGLFTTLNQDATSDGSPFSTITIDVRPDP